MPFLLSMSNGKKKINIRMKAFFSAWGEGEKEVPYIFFHNFTACQWKLSAIRYPPARFGAFGAMYNKCARRAPPQPFEPSCQRRV